MTGHPGGTLTAGATRTAIVTVGGGFMRSREVREAGEEAGFRGWQFYLAGRAGVLGPVHPDVVVAVVGFFPARLVHPAWEQALGVRPPGEAVARYADACARWGRRRLAGLPRAERLAELMERVVEAADPAGLVLFAGWRAVPRPDDPPARVAHLAHLLREHRGGAHLAAVLAAGLTPLQAILAGRQGEANARYFGWPEPYDEVSDRARAAHARAEAVTDAVAGPAYETLAPLERAELVELLSAALHTAFPEERLPA